MTTPKNSKQAPRSVHQRKRQLARDMTYERFLGAAYPDPKQDYRNEAVQWVVLNLSFRDEADEDEILAALIFTHNHMPKKLEKYAAEKRDPYAESTFVREEAEAALKTLLES